MENAAAGVAWRAYRLLLIILLLISLIGAFTGRAGDLVLLAVIGNGLLALHGWMTDQGYSLRPVWQCLFVIDSVAVFAYAVILLIDGAGPERWVMPIFVAVIFLPMLYALHAYAWKSDCWD